MACCGGCFVLFSNLHFQSLGDTFRKKSCASFSLLNLSGGCGAAPELVKESITLHSKLLIKEDFPGNCHYEAMPLVCVLFCF